jgi:hypothetical protein
MKKITMFLMCSLLASAAVHAQKKGPAPSLTACNCNDASIRYGRILSIPGNGLQNYRILIEVNLEKKCTVDLKSLNLNGTNINLPGAVFIGAEYAPDGTFMMLQYDVKMASLPAGTAVGTPFTGTMKLAIGSKLCSYKYNFVYNGNIE